MVFVTAVPSSSNSHILNFPDGMNGIQLFHNKMIIKYASVVKLLVVWHDFIFGDMTLPLLLPCKCLGNVFLPSSPKGFKSWQCKHSIMFNMTRFSHFFHQFEVRWCPRLSTWWLKHTFAMILFGSLKYNQIIHTSNILDTSYSGLWVNGSLHMYNSRLNI